MHEFDSVSVSPTRRPSLAAKLTEKSAEGGTSSRSCPPGSDVTAYLKRDRSTAAEPSTTDAAEHVGAADGRRAGAPARRAVAAAPSEPAGWGTAPAGAPATVDVGLDAAATDDRLVGHRRPAGGTEHVGGCGAHGARAGAARRPRRPQPATPSVPAGWYADPAGRFELRYWDGGAWTEHVSRAGQQYTDPPVA